VHVVVPDGIDDPARRSGGNVYDRRVCDGLRALGWRVHEHALPGAWPALTDQAHAPLAATLRGLDDGALVLLDGLIASAAPEVLVPAAARLRTVVLVHLPLGVPPDAPPETVGRERAVLHAAAAVVTTSGWTGRWLVRHHGLDEARVRVAEPGVDEAPIATGTEDGGALLCVAAVVPHKGQDLLLAALSSMPGLPWRCLCVGSTTRDPEFAQAVARGAADTGLGSRFVLAGHRSGADLDEAYAGADLLVLPSRTETYGLVITEALARGLPVIAAAVGGVSEALGEDGTGATPGVLVPPDAAAALAAALRHWFDDAELRDRWRTSAAQRRKTLRRWTPTAVDVSEVLRVASARR
jgi:glycosyltransferase involved in cell wall biosynthesis